ncbi:MAG: nucleotidyltransferase family protein [Tateyamaria sp.]|jgi:molybdenum cofactor cytidylyltransferase|nr:nucleotidyltransferase family protein [Tateyamaria sp.]MCH9832051.1 nucleotidyltransferase family protein [Alphaproteobacteria bacterium]HAB37837.1 4-diphosphocytidyl-2C-methyl-D-erythritol synthase [Paracoccaceae bacterium]HAQ48580.1 4-diphosphocytidyl-2C-methyl-D-erythritol synthase [Glaciecola sp.]MBT7448773.1 nucleotidyltransferase family protein [Tateyamaria sp.]
MITIIILAAGSSSRMRGRDKLLEKIDDIPLLRQQALAALAVSNDVIITLPPAPHPRYHTVSDLNVSPLSVKDATEGISASIRTAIKSLSQKTTKAMLLLADLPEITQIELNTVIAAINSHPNQLVWRGATKDGKPGHPIVFDQSLFNRLMQLTGDNGGQSIINEVKNDVRLVRLSSNQARLDLDTPEEWDAWRLTKC